MTNASRLIESFVAIWPSFMFISSGRRYWRHPPRWPSDSRRALSGASRPSLL